MVAITLTCAVLAAGCAGAGRAPSIDPPPDRKEMNAPHAPRKPAPPGAATPAETGTVAGDSARASANETPAAQFEAPPRPAPVIVRDDPPAEPAAASPAKPAPPAPKPAEATVPAMHAPAPKPAETSVPAKDTPAPKVSKPATPTARPAPAAKAEPRPAAAPVLDLGSLEKRLKDTPAIGVLTKLTLKNQVDDLLERFRAYYGGQLKTTLIELRQPYDLLILKVLSLLQDEDPPLARAIHESREAIWGILSDPAKFAKFRS